MVNELLLYNNSKLTKYKEIDTLLQKFKIKNKKQDYTNIFYNDLKFRILCPYCKPKSLAKKSIKRLAYHISAQHKEEKQIKFNGLETYESTIQLFPKCGQTLEILEIISILLQQKQYSKIDKFRTHLYNFGVQI